MSPTHASTPCLEPGCYRLAVKKGRCAECELLARPRDRAVYDKRRGSSRERGYGRAWEKRRAAWLDVEPFCRHCGRPGNEVDHVIPHRRVDWLFDLIGNLQTLCKRHHSQKTQRERTIPIEMLYPLDLPEPPHPMTTKLLVGPASPYQLTIADEVPRWPEFKRPRLTYGDVPDLWARNVALSGALRSSDNDLAALTIAAPRTAERAFWSYIMDAPAELQAPPVEWLVAGHPAEWWDAYMLDERAEQTIERRLG